jgi:hypothetical protein
VNAIWIDQGDVPDYVKLRARGIHSLYFDIRQSGDLNWGGWDCAARCSDARRHGFIVGVYWGQSWGEAKYTGAAFADKISRQISGMEELWRAAGESLQCEFQIDLETVNGIDHSLDAAWMTAFFKRWRVIRPGKQTSWTLESYQGGPYTWMTRELVSIINTDINLIIVPQLYTGDVSINVDSASAERDLRHMRYSDGTLGGINENRIQFFYEADNYPEVGWRGWLFTSRSLP